LVNLVTGSRFLMTVAQRPDIPLAIRVSRRPIRSSPFSKGRRGQTAIVLSAGAGAVARIADVAAEPCPALSLELERSLVGMVPLAPRNANRVRTIILTDDMASTSGRSTAKRGRRKRCLFQSLRASE
jgi:hypothetical protein